MGFTASSNTVTITAKLTNLGRQKILTNNNTIFTHFILGDSDANYNTSEKLTTGMIPANSGNLGVDGTTNDTIFEPIRIDINNVNSRIDINEGYLNLRIRNEDINSKLFVTVAPITRKPVERNSSKINMEIKKVGENTVSGKSLTYVQLDKTDTSSKYTNYFKSLSFPIRNEDVNVFTNTTSKNGGWSDTSFSSLGATKVLMGVIDTNEYGALIDGTSVKLKIPVYTGYTTGGTPTGLTTYTLYSTYPKTTISKKDLDSHYTDRSSYPQSLFGRSINVSYLVSDNIRRPNNNHSLSWGTGYDSFKPFSLNNKELINVNRIPATGINKDEIVGVVYLDKGIFAITDQTIVNNVATNFSGDSGTTTVNNSLGLYYYTGDEYNCVVDSVQKDLVMDIVCIAARGEFYNSQNETQTVIDDVRISEVGITDPAGNLLAIGKPDRHIIKKKSDIVIINVKINMQ